MAEKKIVLFIVEGKNDKKEIESILHTPYFEGFLKNYKPYFQLVENDITADKNSTESNIQDKVSKVVRDFRKKGVPFSNIKVSEIDRVVHIVDMDGAFIPRNCIQFAEVGRFVYEEECLKTNNPDVAYGRNRKKANILRVLNTIDKIDNIIYEIYYVSCNMDHMLFGRINISAMEKASLANEFVKECNSNPHIIFETVFAAPIGSNLTYAESWKDIQVGTNSLNRHTNINLYFEKIIDKET